MNKTGKVNGFRILCRMAMAELMLRKKEQRANQGYARIDHQVAARSLDGLGFIKIQAIPTYDVLMDYALCFMLRFEAQHMLNHANIQLEIASRIAPEFKHHKFIYDHRKQDRQEAERQEDDEYEDQEETDKWLEEQRARTQSERNKRRKAEALARQQQACREYGDAIRFIRDNPQMEQEYKDLWIMIRELAEREEFKTPYEVTP